MNRILKIALVVLSCLLTKELGAQDNSGNLLEPIQQTETPSPKIPSDYSYEVRLGWGGFPFLDAATYGRLGGVWTVYDVDYRYNPGSLVGIYSSYSGPTYLTGIISAEFDFNFRKWFSLTIGLGFDGIYEAAYAEDTGLRAGNNMGVVTYILPEARFNWLNKSIVRMYSAVGLGFSLGAMGGDYFHISILPACQLTPVGISLGRKVYGFAELGLGTQFCGVMAGVGFRFK